MSSPEVGTYLAGNVHPVRVNPESGRDEAGLAGRFGVRHFPSVYLVPKPGAPIQKISIPGNLTPAQFVTKLKRAAAESG